MKRSTISVTLRSGAREDRDGYVLPDCPGLGIARTSRKPRRWAVTHLPSGGAVCPEIPTLAAAIWAAAEMAKLIPDWSGTAPEVQAAGALHRDAITDIRKDARAGRTA